MPCVCQLLENSNVLNPDVLVVFASRELIACQSQLEGFSGNY